MANRGSFGAIVAPDLRRVIVETGKERPLEHPMVMNVEDMEWNSQKDRQVAGLGAMPSKPEGSQFKLDAPVQGNGVTYTAQPFGLAVELTWELWRDELYGVMRDMVRELARSSRHRAEVDAWSVLNNAFDVTVTGFDGKNLCSLTHVGIDGVTRANRPTPDIGLSVTGVQAAVVRFENMTNERGLPMLLSPTRVIISPTNLFVAREVLGSSGKPYSADNELNALIQDDLSWFVTHYMAVPTYWFMLAAKGQHDLQMLWRDRPIFDNFDDEWTKSAIFSVYQRHTKGFGSFRGVDGSTG
jgi:hypothetical protein